MIRNLDNCEYSNKDGEYGGASGLKEGLLIDGENWLVKYPKNASYLEGHEEMSYTNDPVSEYLGSHIYEILGYPVHKTMLAERRGKIVVACKDFLKTNERLVEFRTLKNSANNDMAELFDRDFSSTGSAYIVDFEEIMLQLQYNKILTRVNGVKDRFFDQIVIDAFINNSDRNNGNWGIVRSDGRPDVLAPIYDNGGSFNGKTPDSRLAKLLKRENGVTQSILNGVSIYGKDNRYHTRDLLNFDIPGLHQALIRNVPVIREHLSEIYTLVDSVDEKACSEVRKVFYKECLERRYALLLEPAYQNAIRLIKAGGDYVESF